MVELLITMLVISVVINIVYFISANTKDKGDLVWAATAKWTVDNTSSSYATYEIYLKDGRYKLYTSGGNPRIHPDYGNVVKVLRHFQTLKTNESQGHSSSAETT